MAIDESEQAKGPGFYWHQAISFFRSAFQIEDYGWFLAAEWDEICKCS
jgi:hypothetical protein